MRSWLISNNYFFLLCLKELPARVFVVLLLFLLLNALLATLPTLFDVLGAFAIFYRYCFTNVRNKYEYPKLFQIIFKTFWLRGQGSNLEDAAYETGREPSSPQYVVPQGFEPQLDVPNTPVLPLYQRTLCTQGRTRTDTPLDTVSKTAVYTIPPLGYCCVDDRTRTHSRSVNSRKLHH